MLGYAAMLGYCRNGIGIRNRVPVSSRELLEWGLRVGCWLKALYRDLMDIEARGI